MSTLTLVRHGQARPFEKDSDLLSDLGALQSRALGEYWKQHGVRFTDVITGSLVRHLQTEEQVRGSGYEMPPAVIDVGWNEYDAPGVIGVLAPRLAAVDADFAARRREFEAMAHGPDRNRYFQRMLEVLMDAWLQGRVEAEGAESFAAFRERVQTALRRIVDGPSNRDVVVFTSGGPIGYCVQQAMRAPDSTFLDVNWRMRNASVTEFTYSRGRFSLDTLNVLSHLYDRSLWTYR